MQPTYRDNAENCEELARAASGPNRNRLHRLAKGWRALAETQDWLDGRMPPVGIWLSEEPHDQLGPVHRNRGVASLEQVAVPARPRVDETGVPSYAPAHGTVQALDGRGYQDQVDVVGHQAMAQNLDPMPARLLGKPSSYPPKRK